MKRFICLYLLATLVACSGVNKKSEAMKYKTTGTLERLDTALDAIISADAKAEIIAEGLDWSEGPLWVESHQMLLFSDVPRDTVFKWTEERGKEVYLTPSGYTGSIPRGGEMGSNGLTLDNEGHLVLCQCGNRQIARMDAPLNNPAPKYIPLASNYDGKRFNSPNDVAIDKHGNIYFTDPPYGLEKGMKDIKKEISFQGVYVTNSLGKTYLVSSQLTRPNGIAFFPDGRLLVSNSDPDLPNWYLIDIGPDDTIMPPKIFYSAAGYEKGLKGLPDGLKIDKNGNVFATGPGGLYIFNGDGKLLGRIHFPEATSNCSLSGDEKILYITNDMYVLRLKMRD